MILLLLQNQYSIEILYYFLENPHLELSVQKLKEKTRFSNNVLYNGLNTLVSHNIIENCKGKYSINYKNSMSEEILKILEDEKKKFKRIKTQEYLLILKIIKECEQLPFSKLYLFGSFARGNFRPSSDIDIAIIGTKQINTQELQLRIEKHTSRKIDIHYISKIDKENLLHDEILTQGMLLLEKKL